MYYFGQLSNTFGAKENKQNVDFNYYFFFHLIYIYYLKKYKKIFEYFQINLNDIKKYYYKKKKRKIFNFFIYKALVLLSPTHSRNYFHLIISMFKDDNKVKSSTLFLVFLQ